MVRLFRHYMPRRLLMLGVVEMLICISAIYLGRSLRFLHIAQPPTANLLPEALVFTVVMIGIMMVMGLYERNFWDDPRHMILRIGASFLLGLLVMSLIYYLFPDLYFGRGEFSLAISLAFVLIILVRFAFLSITDREFLKRRILALGAGNKAAQLDRLSHKLNGNGFKVLGYVPLNGAATAVDPNKVLKVRSKLSDLAEQLQVDEIVVAVDDRRKCIPVEELLDCKIRGVQVSDLLTFYERETGKIHLDALHPSGMIYCDGFCQAVLKTTSKRLCDLCVSLLLLALVWPIMLLTAAAIWIESGGRGPICYRQERVGRDGRLFKVLKFRSMRPDAEQDGVAQWAQENDSRITWVGSFIRRVRIDELPQLINVLRGDMSFIGPRPERPEFVTELSKSIPYYGLRHRVNPGITGWAQICYPYGASKEDSREKLQYDLYYIKNYSLFLDLLILLHTAHVILWGKGAR